MLTRRAALGDLSPLRGARWFSGQGFHVSETVRLA